MASSLNRSNAGVSPTSRARWRRCKRAIDVVVASVALVILLPVFVAVSIAVMVGLGRPITFRQIRPGINGDPFVLVKFRTMRPGDEADSERLTRFGRILRATSMDELPELWHVLRGDMSLVGPRPLLMEYLPLYSERQDRRHEIRPGITGLAQVAGRNDLNWDDRLELDVQYVEESSPRLDAQILLRTVVMVATRRGISASGHATVERFSGTSRQRAA